MKLENSINYYYTVLALRLLLERGRMTAPQLAEHFEVQRRNFPPGEGVHLATLGMDFRPGFW